MKNRIQLLIPLLFFFLTIHAQRYLEPVFENVSIEENIAYGLNTNPLSIFLVGEFVPQILKMDVYAPTGDTQTDRPLVILVSAGGYMPFPMNYEVYKNDRKDLEIVYLANQLAKYGYVVSVIDLRLGWNPLATIQAERAFSYTRAVMRQCQDLRTAVRYFRKSAIGDNNPFGIDSNKIVGWGVDSGTLPVAFAAYVTDYLTEFVPNYLTVINGVVTPVWVEAEDGDIYALEFGFSSINGDTLSYPNHPDFNSDLNLAVHLGGAALDTITISPEDPPLISFQSMTEGKYSWWTSPLLSPAIQSIIPAFGQGSIHTRVHNVGLNSVMQTVNFFDDITAIQNQRVDENPDFFPKPFPELFPFDDGYPTPWSFWNPDNENNMFSAYSSSNEPDYCKSLLDTVITFYAPRACLALALGCNLASGLIPATGKEAGIQLSPNPANDYVVIHSNNSLSIQTIELYDASGRLVKTLPDIMTSTVKLQKGNLQGGVYFVKAYFENSVAIEKLLFY